MNEVKSPKKPLLFYYGVVLLILMLFNFLAMPWLAQRQVREVDYGTFMTMTEEHQIGQVEVQENQILFTDRESGQIYKTGVMNDPDLIYRLKDSGAVFAGEIVEQMSPFLSLLLTWILPIILFVGLGQYMSRRMIICRRAGRSKHHALKNFFFTFCVYIKAGSMTGYPNKERIMYHA